MDNMSEYPSSPANRHWDSEWTESSILCPKCQNVNMWQAGWFDGTPENGGACIGTKYECGTCGYYYSL